MDLSRIRDILGGFGKLRIGVLGDFCLDAYWLLDETRIEDSIETGKPTRAVRKQDYSLGGAGNIVSNLAAMGIGGISAFGVIGSDVFGREMLELLAAHRVDATAMIVQKEDWATPVYAKPYIGLNEQSRFDFGRFNALGDETAGVLLSALEKSFPGLDGLIVNQQLKNGIHAPKLIEGLQRIVDRNRSKIVLLDARDAAGSYKAMIVKLNAGEAARLCGIEREINQAVTVDELMTYSRQINERTGREVVITRSDRGILAFDGGEFFQVPGVLTFGPLDPVGAGDTTSAGITASLAAGANLAEAIGFANYSAAVVVQKLRQTGTADPGEIMALAEDCDFVQRPELAEDIRKSVYLEDSEIEITNRDLRFAGISHVIFDHDGTLSTLRQGWEGIMEPVMVKAILGGHYLDASEELYQRVMVRIRGYIDQSTGIETIVQMEALADMVRQFGMVPPGDILEPEGYKELYNRALMEMVDKRISKLRAGELSACDFTVKGGCEFLETLHGRGVKLYLASGTDHADVVREAGILGYADFFTGIYGWTGRAEGSVKKKVIERILNENKLSGGRVACVGDGPVELRLAKKAGGLAIGVASDEVRRYGLNPAKRTRLVKAGADIVIPDYSQGKILLKFGLFTGM